MTPAHGEGALAGAAHVAQGYGAQVHVARAQTDWVPAAASSALRALAVGRRRSATVIGTASEALIVRVDDAQGAAPTIVTIVTHRGVRQPLSIVLPVAAALPAISVGAPVALGEGSITIGQMNLRVTRWWNPRLVLAPSDPCVVRSRADRLMAQLDVGGRPQFGLSARFSCTRQPARDNTDIAALGLVQQRGDRLVLAWSSGRTDVIDAATTGLIGLGPGSTPAGDDLVAGFVAMLAAFGHPGFDRLAVSVEQVLRHQPTTELSGALLRHAVAGDIAFEARATMQWVAGARDLDTEDPIKALDQLLGVGATSGWALARGIALAACASMHEPAALTRG